MELKPGFWEEGFAPLAKCFSCISQAEIEPVDWVGVRVGGRPSLPDDLSEARHRCPKIFKSEGPVEGSPDWIEARGSGPIGMPIRLGECETQKPSPRRRCKKLYQAARELDFAARYSR
jgi:hypothetical protein